ncbi:MAG: RNA-binding S4 domain-containing protein [Verrucomicrobiales bacterium]|nr:RNA-binding S4 domain-containing protein [Verrucomicrobiales bacterium]
MDSDTEETAVRLDIWLWATRLYKTRSQASNACKNNRVEIAGQTARPSRKVRVGDEIVFKKGNLTRTVEVKDLLLKRVGAKRVEEFLIDHTPESEYQQAAEIRRVNRESRPDREAGAGRPTKKERRTLDELLEESGDEASNFEEFSKAMNRNRSAILIFGLLGCLFFLFGKGETVFAQESVPKRNFEVKDGTAMLPLNERLVVHAKTISPEKNPETGALTSMAATGDVLIKVKPGEAKDWILVACDKAVYDPTADSIKLTGFPAVKSGRQILRATEAATFVKVDRKTGKWEIVGKHRIELNLKGR